jgi:hypothetical protein
VFIPSTRGPRWDASIGLVDATRYGRRSELGHVNLNATSFDHVVLGAAGTTLLVLFAT